MRLTLARLKSVLGREIQGEVLEEDSELGHLVYRFEAQEKFGRALQCILRASTREERCLSSSGLAIRVLPEQGLIEIHPYGGSLIVYGEADCRVTDDGLFQVKFQDSGNMLYLAKPRGGEIVVVTDDEVSVWQVEYLDVSSLPVPDPTESSPDFKFHLQEILGDLACEPSLLKTVSRLSMSLSSVDQIMALGYLIRHWSIQPQDVHLLRDWKVVTPQTRARCCAEKVEASVWYDVCVKACLRVGRLGEQLGQLESAARSKASGPSQASLFGAMRDLAEQREGLESVATALSARSISRVHLQTELRVLDDLLLKSEDLTVLVKQMQPMSDSLNDSVSWWEIVLR